MFSQNRFRVLVHIRTEKKPNDTVINEIAYVWFIGGVNFNYFLNRRESQSHFKVNVLYELK